MNHPDPLEVEKLVSEDARRLEIALDSQKPITAPLDSLRAKCIRRLQQNLGEGGFREFLRQPQPAFGDRTGGHVLQNDPEALLIRLDLLEKQADFDAVEDDYGYDEVIHDHRPYQAPKHKINRVLSILDEIERETSNRRFTR